MKAIEIKHLLEENYPEADMVLIENASPQGLEIKPELLLTVMTFLHSHPHLYFDSLSCITGMDNGAETDELEVIYNLYSIPKDIHLMIKVTIKKSDAVIDSLTDIWRTADWQEREVFDLFGIHFNQHPDMRRILLPADWEGHPLRKDYKEQVYYRGIQVKY